MLQDEIQTKAGISRRSFVSGASFAALGAGLLGAGALAGCSPTQSAGGASGTSSTSGSTTSSSTSTASSSTKTASTSGTSPYALLNPQEEIDSANSITDWSKTTMASSFKLGNVEVGNRFVKTAATSGIANSEKQVVPYFGAIAEGGVGAVFVEGSYILTEKIDTEYVTFAMGADTRLGIDNGPLKAIADEVHSHNVPVFIQMKWGTPGINYVFSNCPAEGSNTAASELSLDDIQVFIQDVADAAKKLQGIGYDGVEINAAGDNVPSWFLSRFRNDREASDAYGPASFENRTRLVCDCVKAIKEACGSDFPVQVRMNGIEENDEALGQDELISSAEEVAELAKCIEAAGADSIHVILGVMANHNAQFLGDAYFAPYGMAGANGMGTFFDFKKHFGGHLDGTHHGIGLMLGATEVIKKAVSIPVGAATYMDPAMAPDFFEAALNDGKIDFLCINRPVANADQQYVNKLFDGRLDEIRPCCRCLHCANDANNHLGTQEGCRVNACKERAFGDAMPEGYDVPAADGSKKIMVIGGGPAGMEAARVAAERGYSVSLYEKNALGGLMSFAEMVKGKHEHLGKLTSYFTRQLELLGVDVQTGKEVDAAFVKEQKPDVVIVATGGVRQELSVKGTDATPVVDITDFMSAELGENVVVAGFNAQAYDTAFYLMAQGKNVTMVSDEPEANLGKGQSNTMLGFTQPAFYSAGGRVLSNSTIDAIGSGEVTVTNGAGVELTLPCDAVVCAVDMAPNSDLEDELGSEFTAVTVGDAADPWDIQAAIATANLAARAC